MAIDYNTAYKLAEKFKRINKQLKLTTVGSIARKEEQISDLDFITTLKLPNDKKYFRTEFEGMQVDIWQYENRKIGKFIRTLKDYQLINLYNKLKEHNYKLESNGIKNLSNNKLIILHIK